MIARQHHRSRATDEFMISTALPVLCRCILQNPDSLAIDRAEKTLNRTLVSNMYFVYFFKSYIIRFETYGMSASFRYFEFDFGFQCTHGSGLNQGLDLDGKRFWGQGDLFTRRRTVRDLFLITYHDAAAEILFHSE